MVAGSGAARRSRRRLSWTLAQPCAPAAAAASRAESPRTPVRSARLTRALQASAGSRPARGLSRAARSGAAARWRRGRLRSGGALLPRAGGGGGGRRSGESICILNADAAPGCWLHPGSRASGATRLPSRPTSTSPGPRSNPSRSRPTFFPSKVDRAWDGPLRKTSFLRRGCHGALSPPNPAWKEDVNFSVPPARAAEKCAAASARSPPELAALNTGVVALPWSVVVLLKVLKSRQQSGGRKGPPQSGGDQILLTLTSSLEKARETKNSPHSSAVQLSPIVAFLGGEANSLVERPQGRRK